MRCIVVLFVAVVAGATAASVLKETPSSRISGGTLVKHKHGYAAEVLTYNKVDWFEWWPVKSCGGAIIDKNWVVSTSTCVRKFGGWSGYCSWGLCKSKVRLADGKHYGIKDVKYKEYNENTKDDNIALINLDAEVTFNNEVKRASLPPQSQEFKGSATLVGLTKSANEKMIAEVEITSCADGMNIYKRFCTTSSNNRGACDGDDGTPLTQSINDVYYKLIGLVIPDEFPCGGSKPTVYIDLSEYSESFIMPAIYTPA